MKRKAQQPQQKQREERTSEETTPNFANPEREKRIHDIMACMNNNSGKLPKNKEELEEWNKNNPNPRW